MRSQDLKQFLRIGMLQFDCSNQLAESRSAYQLGDCAIFCAFRK